MVSMHPPHLVVGVHRVVGHGPGAPLPICETALVATSSEGLSPVGYFWDIDCGVSLDAALIRV